jgi:hypothetical protein
VARNTVSSRRNLAAVAPTVAIRLRPALAGLWRGKQRLSSCIVASFAEMRLATAGQERLMMRIVVLFTASWKIAIIHGAAQ